MVFGVFVNNYCKLEIFQIFKFVYFDIKDKFLKFKIIYYIYGCCMQSVVIKVSFCGKVLVFWNFRILKFEIFLLKNGVKSKFRLFVFCLVIVLEVVVLRIFKIIIVFFCEVWLYF